MAGDLYLASNGRSTSTSALRSALRDCGAHDCNVLFVHAGINFGAPSAPRAQLLQALTQTLQQLGPATLCFPTFTFSFINGEVHDPQNTPSRMGVLSEYFRKLPETIRSPDPLMSVAATGPQARQLTTVGSQSCGENSSFHRLSQTDGVRFLFFGVRAQDCFTYMHFLEWTVRAPYRFNREFHGTLQLKGHPQPATATLFVRHPGVFPGPGNAAYEQQLSESGVMRTQPFGDNFVHCVPEAAAKSLWLQLYRHDPGFFISSPFTPPDSPPTDFEHSLPMVAM
ncbi:MAG: AAC(3) family N-acetyltransferase [Planctomycetota bacterium]